MPTEHFLVFFDRVPFNGAITVIAASPVCLSAFPAEILLPVALLVVAVAVVVLLPGKPPRKVLVVAVAISSFLGSIGIGWLWWRGRKGDFQTLTL